MPKKSSGASVDPELFRLYDQLDRLEELLEDMAEFAVTSVADIEQKIVELNEQIDALEQAESGQ